MSVRAPLAWLAALVGIVAGCVGAGLPGATPASAFTQRDRIDAAKLQQTRQRADQAPDDARAQFVAGMAHVRATLRGHLEARDAAERYLERAYRLDPDAFPSARVLGRFANLRSSVLDTSRIDLQVELHGWVAGTAVGEPLEQSATSFHAHGFVAADWALKDLAEGRLVSAWQRVRALERDLAARTRAYPDEIDTFAMAGTFASTFAAALPVGKRRRARAAAEYFDVQQTRWFEQTPPARNTGWAPNTRSVFALARAELWLASGDIDAARRAYDHVIALDEPDTRIRAQLIEVAQHRRQHTDAYVGDTKLLPPWPNGTTACVACHARDTTLPTTALYVIEGLDD